MTDILGIALAVLAYTMFWMCLYAVFMGIINGPK